MQEYFGRVGLVAFVCLWGCSEDGKQDRTAADLGSPLVNDCTTNEECGTGYACTLTGTCVRPSSCTSSASGSGVFTGSLVVDGTDTQTDLDDLGGAWCVTGDVTVKNTTLSNLVGLESLLAIRGTLAIEDNASLATLHGLENLHRTLKLSLMRNASLTSLAALSQLETLTALQVYVNPGLHDLSGMESVESISWMEVVNNAGLTSLAGLNSINRVYSYVDVRFNPQLTDLSGLGSVATVGSLLRIMDNSALSELAGLESLTSIGRTLTVGRNPELTSLNGLANLTYAPSFQVADNPKLDSCNVAAVAAQAAADCSGCTNNGPCTPPDDLCPDDPDKLEPGICGCNVADTDTDGDNIADCLDPCPADNPDDSDSDTVCDSADQCPGFDDRVDADHNGLPDDCQECVSHGDCAMECMTGTCSVSGECAWSPVPVATEWINGDFRAGDLTGFSTYTTDNGTATITVEAFDTAASGVATSGAKMVVGRMSPNQRT